MKKSFFKQTYFSIITLFLILLNVSFLIVGVYTYKNNRNSVMNSFYAEASAISDNIESAVYTSTPDDRMAIQYTYGSLYTSKGIFLQFKKGYLTTHTTLPKDVYRPSFGEITEVRHNRSVYHIYSTYICNGDYELTVVKDVSFLAQNHTKLSLILLVSSAVLSILLFIVLYALLKQLYSPLDNIRETAIDIAKGNYSCKAAPYEYYEFQLIADAFNKMAVCISEQMNTLQKSADLKQTMLDDLAHEMRTPLTVINGYAEYALTANIPQDELIDSLNNITKETARLKKISESLLDMAFIRNKIIEKKDVELSAVINETTERFILKSRNNNITIIQKPSEVSIKGDPILLEVLISNLLDNAIKACNYQGIIEIGAFIDKNTVILYVKDNGKGMSADQTTRITEPFYRIDKSRSREAGGVGLGLSLCKSIAEAHEAELSFESSVGNGCTVYVKFNS